MVSRFPRRELWLSVCLIVACTVPSARTTAEPLDEGDLRALRDAMAPGGEDPSGAVGVFHTSLLLVGMSERGALATLQYRDDDVLPSWVLQIVNLVDDQVLQEQRWEDPEGQTGLAVLIAGHGTEILAALADHHIGEQRLALVPFPVESHAGAFGLEVTEGELWLTAPNRARKRIGRASSAASMVCGLVASPYERRIAVVLRSYEPGFEGTSNARYQFVGAHLDTGFASDAAQMQPTPRVQAFVASLEEMGFFPDPGEPRLGDPSETMMSQFVPAAFDGATARFGYVLKKREDLGGGLYPEVKVEEWQFASAAAASASFEALTTAQQTQSDTGPMWKMPHTFAIEGRYLYVVKTRAHAFIPDWREVMRRLEADLAENG